MHIYRIYTRGRNKTAYSHEDKYVEAHDKVVLDSGLKPLPAYLLSVSEAIILGAPQHKSSNIEFCSVRLHLCGVDRRLIEAILQTSLLEE